MGEFMYNIDKCERIKKQKKKAKFLALITILSLMSGCKEDTNNITIEEENSIVSMEETQSKDDNIEETTPQTEEEIIDGLYKVPTPFIEVAENFELSPLRLLELCSWYGINIEGQKYKFTNYDIAFLTERYEYSVTIHSLSEETGVDESKIVKFFESIDAFENDNRARINLLEKALYNYWDNKIVSIYDFATAANIPIEDCLNECIKLNPDFNVEEGYINGVDFMIVKHSFGIGDEIFASPFREVQPDKDSPRITL